jgi:NTP pyrophosphatase (non-canonical NTP hydrolase)
MRTKSWWALQKFGKLRVREPEDISPDSNMEVLWVCECGQSKLYRIMDVTKGTNRDCGSCQETLVLPTIEAEGLISKYKDEKLVKTRSEILAKIEEIDNILSYVISDDMREMLVARRDILTQDLLSAYEDVITAAISSHHVMCEVKNMRPDEAFGNDPFIYYGLGLAGEVGELTGALLRAMRNGGSYEDMKMAAESELADCMIYAIILAYSTGIDLTRLVNEKARIVELRARSGYYGSRLDNKLSS